MENRPVTDMEHSDEHYEALSSHQISEVSLNTPTSRSQRKSILQGALDLFAVEEETMKESDGVTRVFGEGLSRRNSTFRSKVRETKNDDLDDEVDRERDRERSPQFYLVDVHTLPVDSIKIDMNIDLTSSSELDWLVDGKCSNIYKANWAGEDIIVKKLMNSKAHISEKHKSEFRFEVEFLKRAGACPNIVQVLGSGQQQTPEGEELPFIFLERLNGGSLTYKLTQKRFPANRPFRSTLQAYQYMVSLAKALQFIHYDFDPSVHVIHRDLKPDNVAFTKAGELKLIDFGLSICIARFNNPSETYQMTGETGSMRYMAPEVISGLPYNEKVDVYGFGIMMWEMCTGVVPFAGLSRAAFTKTVVDNRQRPPLIRDPFGEMIYLPEKLKDLMVRCWAHEHEDRPTMTECLQILAEISEEERERAESQKCCTSC